MFRGVGTKEAEILRAAIKVFAEKGARATISDIATAANMQDSAIYKRFRSKEELLLAIYNSFWDEILVYITGVASDTKWEADSIAKLKQITNFVQTFISSEFDLVRMISTVFMPPPEKIEDDALKQKRLMIREKNREVLRTIDNIIKDGQAGGYITDSFKPQVIRQALMGTFQTLAYGLLIQFGRNEDVGYSPSDALDCYHHVMESFSKKVSD